MTAQVWAPVALFIGGLKPLPPEGQRTGMFKTHQLVPVFCGVEELSGDQQGDRRVYGAPGQGGASLSERSLSCAFRSASGRPGEA